MPHVTKRLAFVLLLLLASLGLIPANALAQGQSPLMPAHSNAFGKSSEQWNVLQTQWAIALGLGTAAGHVDQVGRVRLLPGSFDNAFPVFDIALPPGTPFVASPFFLFGERYEDGSEDNPADLADLIALVFADAHIRIALDGQTLVEGSGTQLKKLLFGPTYFEAPIAYNVPQDRGDVSAVAALWVTGFGAVYRPLAVGEHTLVYTVHSQFFGNSEFTYHITVTPK